MSEKLHVGGCDLLQGNQDNNRHLTGVTERVPNTSQVVCHSAELLQVFLCMAYLIYAALFTGVT